jgi:hypothetical protein
MDISVETKLMVCDCNSSEHTVIVKYFKDDKYGEVFLDIHLTVKPLWQRIVHAVKYVFGYTSKFGAFDELILTKGHIKDLESIITHIKKVEANKKQLTLFDE